MSNDKKSMTKEEVQKIMELLQEALKESGMQIQTALLVDDIDDEGNLEGEVLVDNRDTEDLN